MTYTNKEATKALDRMTEDEKWDWHYKCKQDRDTDALKRKINRTKEKT